MSADVEPYELRRGDYKNLTLRVQAPDGKLRVSAPWFVPKPLVDRFVAEKAPWIEARRRALAAAGPPDDGAPDRVPDRVWVWGQAFPLRVEAPGRRPRVVFDPGASEVVVRVPAGTGPEAIHRALDAWEKERVAAALTVLVPRWTARTGLAVASWTVKTLRSRWGSCRPDRKTLVFNGRLGAYHPGCLEHVVVHELAHLVERSHNARFHGLVEAWLPGAEAVRKVLRAGPGASFPAGPGA